MGEARGRRGGDEGRGVGRGSSTIHVASPSFFCRWGGGMPRPRGESLMASTIALLSLRTFPVPTISLAVWVLMVLFAGRCTRIRTEARSPTCHVSQAQCDWYVAGLPEKRHQRRRRNCSRNWCVSCREVPAHWAARLLWPLHPVSPGDPVLRALLGWAARFPFSSVVSTPRTQPHFWQRCLIPLFWRRLSGQSAQ